MLFFIYLFIRWHGNCYDCINKHGWFNNQESMNKLNYAREMTKRREAFIKKKFPKYKFVTMQECKFDTMCNGLEYAKLVKDVELDMSTTFIPPRVFYCGGKLYYIMNMFKNVFKMSFFII